MLLIPSTISASDIHGLGCFTTTNIPKGARVWTFHPEVDTTYHSPPPRRQRKHAYKSVTQERTWVLPTDNASFINFSDKPNLIMSNGTNEDEPDLIAGRFIQAGEELTVGSETDGDYQVKMTWR